MNNLPVKTFSKAKTGRFGSLLSSVSEGDDVDLLTNNEELDSLMNPVLLHRGIRSEHFFLIVQGRVCICSGNEGFIVEKGTFEYFGEESITDRSYLPDYSAKVLGHTKLLRISREDYQKARLKEIK